MAVGVNPAEPPRIPGIAGVERRVCALGGRSNLPTLSGISRIYRVYGASISDVAQAVRQNIITRVREMTGLIVKEVNIDVIDLYFPGDEAAQPEPAQPASRRVE